VTSDLLSGRLAVRSVPQSKATRALLDTPGHRPASASSGDPWTLPCIDSEKEVLFPDRPCLQRSWHSWLSSLAVRNRLLVLCRAEFARPGFCAVAGWCLDPLVLSVMNPMSLYQTRRRVVSTSGLEYCLPCDWTLLPPSGKSIAPFGRSGLRLYQIQALVSAPQAQFTLKLQRGQKSPAGGAFCQYALKSGTMTVNATEVASDAYVSAERESTDKPTASAVGS
jgi:hypothetical protein